MNECRKCGNPISNSPSKLFCISHLPKHLQQNYYISDSQHDSISSVSSFSTKITQKLDVPSSTLPLEDSASSAKPTLVSSNIPDIKQVEEEMFDPSIHLKHLLSSPSNKKTGDEEPIFLLADSQILCYRHPEGQGIVEGILYILQHRDSNPKELKEVKASYIGASNEDLVEYYDIFLFAMESSGLSSSQCRMIPSVPSLTDVNFLRESAIILLAGGDCSLGLC